jgi:tetratricopeptide (TPR) repeat protein
MAIQGEGHSEPGQSKPGEGTRRGRWFWYGAIFVCALSVRSVHLWQMSATPFLTVKMGDATSYDAWAREIAAGDWLGQEVFYQAPLYPYFLGAVYTLLGDDPLTLRVVQALIGALACVLLAAAGWRFFCKRVGIAAGLMLAFYPPAIFFDSLIQKSVLDLFFLSLALWLLSRFDNAYANSTDTESPRQQPLNAVVWWTLGMAIGCLTLTRENALVIALAVFVWIWFRQGSRRVQRLDSSALFAGGLLVVLLPVAVRNQIVGGEFHLTTSQFGTNLFIGNNAQSDGLYIPLRRARGDPKFEREDATQIAAEALGREPTSAEVSAYFTRRTWDYVKNHPGDWLALMGRKTALAFNGVEVADVEDQYTYAQWSAPLRLGGFVWHFGIVAPLAVLGVWLTWGERSRLWLLYLIFVSYTFSIVLFYIFARYRLPLVPVMLLFAAAGLVHLPQLRSQRSPARIAGWLSVSAAVVVLCNWPLVSKIEERANTCLNVGLSLYNEGRLDEAAEFLSAGLELDPEYVDCHNALGIVRMQQRQYATAVVHFRRAVELNPYHAAARYQLGRLLVQEGKLEEAAKQFEHLLRSTPDDVRAGHERGPENPTVHKQLGNVLVKLDRPRQAVTHLRAALLADPQNAETHFNLGQALCGLGEFDEGIVHYRRTLEIDPESAPTHNNWGIALCRQHRFEEGAEHFQEAVRIDPRFAQAYNNLGRALCNSGRTDEGMLQYRKAVSIDPRFAQAQRNLGAALETQRRTEDAIQAYREALAIDPQSAHAHFRLGRLLLQQGERESAITHLREAVRLEPGLLDAQELLDQALNAETSSRAFNPAVR